VKTPPTFISAANDRRRATFARGALPFASTNRSTPVSPLRARRGTSLVELLVVIAIVGVLIAILLPAVARVRQSSRDVVCQGRLRKLTTACMLYRAEHRAYPRPAPPPPQPMSLLPSLLSLLGGLLEPQKIDLTVLNQLAKHAEFARVPPGAPAIDLPAELQSPDVESIESGRGPILLPSGQSTYYTGFNYVPGLDTGGSSAVPPGALRVLKPERMPGNLAAGDRAVIWADDVHGTGIGSSGEVWQFTHAKSSAAAGPQPLTYGSASDCRGQHRAYADLSTDWVRGDELDLQGKTPAALDAAATYWAAGTYWWF
jgi:prepilin-type N-terminal cleavage/methylation domain-containing protein